MRNTADQSAFSIMKCVGSNILNVNADWSVVWGQYDGYVTWWRHARDEFGESNSMNSFSVNRKIRILSHL